MKKKGFTLVELLAVIAILAILVIIALPNVMSLFNEAKKNSFGNELKEIFQTAQQQWMTDSYVKTTDLFYSRGENEAVIECGDGTKGLHLSGRTELQYGIKVNKAGDVVNFVATDGTFLYSYSSTDPLKIESIGSVEDEEDSTNYAIVSNSIVRLSDHNWSDATISCENSLFEVAGS